MWPAGLGASCYRAALCGSYLPIVSDVDYGRVNWWYVLENSVQSDRRRVQKLTLPFTS